MEVSLVRKLLNRYRKMQYLFYGRHTESVMSAGVLCNTEPFYYEINHGDIVHPCVRFIEQGFEGHQWWMVYTPYYASNASMENPILCYAESKDSMPPVYWKVYCGIKEGYDVGYNSDPTLFYENNQLYVFWRENQTSRILKQGFQRATWGCKVRHGAIVQEFGPIVYTVDAETDAETCPTFIKRDGRYLCYAMHLKFHLKCIQRLHPLVRKYACMLCNVLDIAGIWSQQKCYGIAIWKSSNIEHVFKCVETVQFLNKNGLYRPWHMDFFEYEGVAYAIIQTNQCNADLCLARSDDYKHFQFFEKPLITNQSIGKVGIYKPTGGVINGVFYLYYTAQDLNDRKMNKMYLATMDFSELLHRLGWK